ncbi:MAG: GNAT family N-acetyltransferase [Bacteroidales bacterium]
MSDSFPILENSHIQLRRMQESDWQAFVPLCSDPAMWTWFTTDLSDEEELKNWVQSELDQAGREERLPFTVIDKANNRIAGSTSLGNFSWRDARVEIGWTWFGRDFQGRGINDQSKYLLLDYCFSQLKMKRVEFKTDVLNLHARKALQRIGAVEEGVLRSHTLMTNNRRRDTIYYSILQEEWAKI